MKRAVAVLCASLALVGPGCVWQFGNTRVEADIQIDEKSLDMTLDSAAAKIQKELEKRGIQVTLAGAGDTVRVACRTKSNDQFTIVLNRVQDPAGKEQTRARVEWSGKADRQLWLDLFVALGPR